MEGECGRRDVSISKRIQICSYPLLSFFNTCAERRKIIEQDRNTSSVSQMFPLTAWIGYFGSITINSILKT